MSQTLVIAHKNVTYYMSRANSRMTSTAVLHLHDRVEICGRQFTVIGFKHKLWEIGSSIAPTTYVYLMLDPEWVMTDELLMQLQMQGFERYEHDA